PDRRVEGETEDQRTEIVFLEAKLLEPRRQPLLRAGNVGIGIVEQDETSRAVERDRAAAGQASEPRRQTRVPFSSPTKSAPDSGSRARMPSVVPSAPRNGIFAGFRVRSTG